MGCPITAQCLTRKKPPGGGRPRASLTGETLLCLTSIRSCRAPWPVRDQQCPGPEASWVRSPQEGRWLLWEVTITAPACENSTWERKRGHSCVLQCVNRTQCGKVPCPGSKHLSLEGDFTELGDRGVFNSSPLEYWYTHGLANTGNKFDFPSDSIWPVIKWK
jgi:hypothetical protein